MSLWHKFAILAKEYYLPHNAYKYSFSFEFLPPLLLSEFPSKALIITLWNEASCIIRITLIWGLQILPEKSQFIVHYYILPG